MIKIFLENNDYPKTYSGSVFYVSKKLTEANCYRKIKKIYCIFYCTESKE